MISLKCRATSTHFLVGYAFSTGLQPWQLLSRLRSVVLLSRAFRMPQQKDELRSTCSFYELDHRHRNEQPPATTIGADHQRWRRPPSHCTTQHPGLHPGRSAAWIVSTDLRHGIFTTVDHPGFPAVFAAITYYRQSSRRPPNHRTSDHPGRHHRRAWRN